MTRHRGCSITSRDIPIGLVGLLVTLLVSFFLVMMGTAAMAQDQEREQHKQLLDILTAENGTNPTAIVGRFQLADSYRNLAQGAERNDTIFRVDIPLTPNWLLRADVGAGWVEPNKPGVSDTFGLNDLFLRTGWRIYKSPDFSIFVGSDAIFPTATDTQLGRGKYEIGPGIAASIPIPAIQSPSNLFSNTSCPSAEIHRVRTSITPDSRSN